MKGTQSLSTVFATVSESKIILKLNVFYQGFPGGSDSKEPTCGATDSGSIPGSGISPGEGMATLSNILGWRIPWTEEPDRLQSMGSQIVRHD